MTPRALRQPFALSGTGGRRALLGWTVIAHVAALAVLVWGRLDGLGPWGRLFCYAAFATATAAWICAIVRRLHDMGRSGAFAPLFAIPVVGLGPLAWALLAPARPIDPERFRAAPRYAVGSVLLLTLVALLASRSLWAPHRMVSEAMAPTLERGTPFLSHGFGLDRPSPGDVVLVGARGPDGARRRLVARVVATGGQSVALQDGVPVLDGVAAAHAPCPGAACTVETLPDGTAYRILDAPLGAEMARMIVPDDALFLLADNRAAPRARRAARDGAGPGLVAVADVEGYVLAQGTVFP